MGDCTLPDPVGLPDFQYMNNHALDPVVPKLIDGFILDQELYQQLLMNASQGWIPLSDLAPEIPENVVNGVDPRSTVYNTPDPQRVFRRPDELSDLDLKFSISPDAGHSNNMDASQDIKPEASPVPKVEGPYYLDMLPDLSYAHGGAFEVSKEEANAEMGLGSGLEAPDEGEEDDEEENGGGEEGEEEEDDNQGSDNTVSKGAVSKSQRHHEVSHISAPSSPKRSTGNNPYGSRGTLSCVSCRRRKGKCIYVATDDDCEFCLKMNHVCGLKYSKGEYQAIQQGMPPPQSSCSTIAKELEKDDPGASPFEIYVRIGQRLAEKEMKRKQAENDFTGSRSPSTASSDSPSQPPNSPSAKRRKTIKV